MFLVAGANPGTSPLFNIPSAVPAPARKTGADDFLNSENDKNDYDWYVLVHLSVHFSSCFLHDFASVFIIVSAIVDFEVFLVECSSLRMLLWGKKKLSFLLLIVAHILLST